MLFLPRIYFPSPWGERPQWLAQDKSFLHSWFAKKSCLVIPEHQQCSSGQLPWTRHPTTCQVSMERTLSLAWQETELLCAKLLDSQQTQTSRPWLLARFPSQSIPDPARLRAWASMQPPSQAGKGAPRLLPPQLCPQQSQSRKQSSTMSSQSSSGCRHSWPPKALHFL